jgi:hypothetical protein
LSQKIGEKAQKNFVRISEFSEKATSGSSHIIIMEAGIVDIKSASKTVGPVRGRRLLDVASAMALAVSVVHQRYAPALLIASYSEYAHLLCCSHTSYA